MTRTLLLSFVLGSLAHASPPPTASKAISHDESARSAWAEDDRKKWKKGLAPKKKKASDKIMLAPSQSK